MSRPLLSMCLIVRDEADRIETCLSSFWDACGECVIADTGSTDKTLELAEAFAEAGEREKLIVGHYEWSGSFADARNYALSLASGEWVAYLDADEVLVGAGWLPRILAVPSASELDALAVSVLAPEVCRVVREGAGDVLAPRTTRCWRRGTARFVGNVQEMPDPVTPGSIRATAMVNPRQCRVERRRDSGRPESMARNLRIAEQWALEEPEDSRAVAMHAFCLYTFHAFKGEPDGMITAAGIAERAQEMTPRWHVAYLLPALVADMQGRPADAARIARHALDPAVRLLDQHGDRAGLAAYVNDCERRAATATSTSSRLRVPRAARGAVEA